MWILTFVLIMMQSIPENLLLFQFIQLINLRNAIHDVCVSPQEVSGELDARQNQDGRRTRSRSGSR